MWERKVIEPLCKILGQPLKKLTIYLAYDQAIALLGASRKMKIYIHTKPCKQMFVVALFMITRLATQMSISS